MLTLYLHPKRCIQPVQRMLTLLFFPLFFVGGSACAHLMPAQKGTINVIDNAAFVVLSLPVSALRGVDKNQDGRLADAELIQHRSALELQVKQGLRLYDGKVAGQVEFIQINNTPDERDEHHLPQRVGGTQLLAMLKIRFAQAPQALRLESDLFGKAASEQQFTLKASRGNEREAIVLRASQPRHHFFRSAPAVLGDYIVLGVEHILFGVDHLLFVLTLIVAAAGWRYWFGILTSFTLAHSITLSVALLGFVHAPAKLVEPLIAASIVLLAALNLWRRDIAPGKRFALVFGCGLLHGLGFASAIGEMGLHGEYQWVSLLGFNLGIELGQAIFLAAVLALGAALVRLKRWSQFDALNLMHGAKRIASSFALIAGGFWMIERIVL